MVKRCGKTIGWGMFGPFPVGFKEKKIICSFLLGLYTLCGIYAQTWTADNGNGTFTNPLFYDEFTDPDLIRVGTDFYMVASSMHVMPGLPLLHSKDLVNWSFVTYVFETLDLGPDFHLEGKKGVYGNGIWAPCIRYYNGKFYIFVNINGYGLQVFIADRPEGPWTHKNMGGTIYDLGVLFDDDGRIYAVHGYDEVHLIEIKPDFSGYVEGSDRVIIPKGSAMGEGHHFYKINGKYYIISADYAPVGRMQCARADRPEGPYKDLLGRPLIDKIVNGAQPIDQFVFRDRDGAYYMFYGGWGHCNVVRLKDDFTGIMPLADGTMYKEITPEGYVEGPFMFIRDGKYYFMWSEGAWTQDNYRVAYGISDNPFGPFERVGTVLQSDTLIGTGAGHHSVIFTPDSDRCYVVYHRHPVGSTDGNNRVVCIDEMFFDENGYIKPIVITNEGVESHPLTQIGR